MDRDEMLRMRLDGETYQAIADKAGISRQRVQQLLSPPSAIRHIIVKRANGRCEDCGVKVSYSGHIHHIAGEEGNYNDINNLKLLCLICHRHAHNVFGGGEVKTIHMSFNQDTWNALCNFTIKHYGVKRALSITVEEAVKAFLSERERLEKK